MDIILSNSSGKPIYEQIVDQIKEQIMTGTLAAGAYQRMVPLNVSFIAFHAGRAPQAYFSLAGKVGKRAPGTPRSPFWPNQSLSELILLCH